MRFARRSLLMMLLRERTALESAVEAIHEYLATRSRRKMLQDGIAAVPARATRRRSRAPRRRKAAL